ncbi:MAG: leucine-rich repeat domain-containing protein, partial [Treponema sp.]|nr:leucine-rich repeat domain-containing protein [Treponema sp.]
MKKLVFGVAIMALVTFSACAQQHCPEGDFIVETLHCGTSVRIVGYRATNSVINIPPRIRNLVVAEIGELAFENRNLTGVTIPGSVIRIGDSAFAGNQLTSATISSGVAWIGRAAFDGNQLTSITIPTGVRSMG